jgi:DNA repair exonuclease SbcCD nuclease subunit
MASKRFGLMTDIHFGLKKASKVVLDWQLETFYKAFKTFKDNDVTDIIILGDVFDNRNTNTTYILDIFLNKFLTPLRRDFAHVYILVGNHDMFYRNKRECNILSTIVEKRYNNVHIIEDITRVGEVLLVPWVCKESDVKKIADESRNGGVLLGHLEVNGFRMTANGKACDNGLSQSLFKGFDLVLSGHFHLKDKIGHIEYLGTMLGLTWAEYHGRHGVHILEGTNLEFYPLGVSMFDVIKFENRVYDIDELERYRNMIVKIMVDEDADDDLFDNLTTKLSKICFTSTKQHIDKDKKQKQVSEILAEALEDSELSALIKSDEDLFSEYINKFLPAHLDRDVFASLYIRVRDKAEQEMEVTR